MKIGILIFPLLAALSASILDDSPAVSLGVTGSVFLDDLRSDLKVCEFAVVMLPSALK